MFNTIKTFKTGLAAPVSRQARAEMLRVQTHNRQVEEATAQNEKARILNESTQSNKALHEGAFNIHSLNNLKMKAITDITKNAPEMILRESMYRLYTKALVLDAEAVVENSNVFRFMTHAYTHHIGGMENLKAQMEATDSAFLRKLYRVCMESGKKLAKSKTDKIKAAKSKDEVAIDFSVDEDMAEDLFEEIDNLSIDEIAEKVKEKVIQVIQDESDKEDDESDLQKELSQVKDDANEDAEVGDEENEPGEDEELAKESFDFTKRFNKICKEGSLFTAIMTGCYKEKLGVIKPMTVKESSDPLKQSVVNNPLNLNIYDIYLQDSNNALGFVDFVKNLDTPDIAGDQTDIDNEEILAEAIAQYTLLECFSTVKLINVSHDNVQAMVRYYMNAK